MIHTLLNVVYVLIAIAMIVLILLQRGAGAQAGSGFGAGASGTVFGARGSANFLSSSTKWLAALFFGLSLFMAWQASRVATPTPDKPDLGVMSDLPAAADKPAPPVQAPLPSVPVQTPPASGEIAPTQSPIIAPPAEPAATDSEQPAAAAPAEDSKGG